MEMGEHGEVAGGKRGGAYKKKGKLYNGAGRTNGERKETQQSVRARKCSPPKQNRTTSRAFVQSFLKRDIRGRTRRDENSRGKRGVRRKDSETT